MISKLMTPPAAVTARVPITVIRWFGRELAIVGVGEPLEVYRRAVHDPAFSQADFDTILAEGEILLESADLGPNDRPLDIRSIL